MKFSAYMDATFSRYVWRAIGYNGLERVPILFPIMTHIEVFRAIRSFPGFMTAYTRLVLLGAALPLYLPSYLLRTEKRIRPIYQTSFPSSLFIFTPFSFCVSSITRVSSSNYHRFIDFVYSCNYTGTRKTKSGLCISPGSFICVCFGAPNPNPEPIRFAYFPVSSKLRKLRKFAVLKLQAILLNWIKCALWCAESEFEICSSYSNELKNGYSRNIYRFWGRIVEKTS